MLELIKWREFFLKIFVFLTLLLIFNQFNWMGTSIGLITLVMTGLYLRYNSTKWLLSWLDLGPEVLHVDKFMLRKNVLSLSKKYDIPPPSIYKLNVTTPIVLGLGSKNSSYILVSKAFFEKLSEEERNALLELTIAKIESNFFKNIEFVTLIHFFILGIGAKIDLFLAFLVGLKRKKQRGNRFYIIFARISVFIIRTINYYYFYTNQKVLLKFDEQTYQNNPHILLALKKAQIYSPFKQTIFDPLFTPFNFANIPHYVPWHRHFKVYPDIEQRIYFMQQDKNLALESLAI